MASFVTGFVETARVLLLVGGGCLAVVLTALCILLFLSVFSAVFDWVTDRIGRHWAKAKRRPRSKLVKIILDAYSVKAAEHGQL